MVMYCYLALLSLYTAPFLATLIRCRGQVSFGQAGHQEGERHLGWQRPREGAT